MIRIHLKAAFRSFRRDKLSFLVNVVGLTCGLASSIILFLWIRQQYSYNDFIPRSAGVYQVVTHYPLNGKTTSIRATSFPIITALQSDIRELKKLEYMQSNNTRHLVKVGDKEIPFDANSITEGFLNVIQRPLLFGDPTKVFADPLSVVISETMARNLFGTNWKSEIRDKTIVQDGWKEYDVTAVFADFPENATLDFDYATLQSPTYKEHVGVFNYVAYAVVDNTRDAKHIEEELRSKIKDRTQATITLQPFQDIHLYSDFKDGVVNGGRIEYVNLFIIASVFILLMACINFMNLFTASAFRRTTEIGTKFVLGAIRSTLIAQIMIEAICIVIVAGVLSILFTYIALPSLNTVLSEDITFPLMSWGFWLIMVGMIILTGAISGFYPSVLLTSFKPVMVLNSSSSFKPGGVGLRKILFSVQFVLSMLLIVFTSGVINQLDFLRNKNLGYNKSDIICQELLPGEIQSIPAIKERLLSQSWVKGVTFVSNDLLSGSPMVGGVEWSGRSAHDTTQFGVIFADRDFVAAMNIETLEGSGTKSTSDGTISLIINESARKVMGNDVVGTPVKVWGGEGEVIGVIRDFHFNSLFSPIQPLIIALMPEESEFLMMRIDPAHYEEAIAFLHETHKTFAPETIFTYNVLEDSINALYQNEINMGRISTLFSVISIIISTLGLFGLTNFTVERRIRELSIRKIMGANFARILGLLTKDFAGMIVLAVVIALPLAYYFLSLWLVRFPYQSGVSITEFILPVLLLMGISLAVISFHAVRVNYNNPVKTLKQK